MRLYQYDHHRPDQLSHWILPTRRMSANSGGLSLSELPEVLLVDDRAPFRQAVATALALKQIGIIQATGVYDALRLARRRAIALIVIRGDLRSQSGWRCAAKLCGLPPWRGVILHFDKLTDQDRRWADVSELAALEQTGGGAKPLAAAVLRVLGVLNS